MSRRVARVSEAVRQVLSQAILFEMNDPRVRDVTITGAEVSGDLRHAKLFVSIMGDETRRHLVMAGLKSARGFLQRKVAQRLELRYTPVLEIVEDEGVKRSLEMSRVLGEVLPRAETPEDSEDVLDDNDISPLDPMSEE
jgi:ribosome-binding factor A